MGSHSVLLASRIFSKPVSVFLICITAPHTSHLTALVFLTLSSFYFLGVSITSIFLLQDENPSIFFRQLCAVKAGDISFHQTCLPSYISKIKNFSTQPLLTIPVHYELGKSHIELSKYFVETF